MELTSAAVDIAASSDIFANAGHTIEYSGIVIAEGADLKRGACLGRIAIGEATAAAVAGGTGNGTLTMDATTPVLAKAKVGVYTVRCITAASDGGVFEVKDPDGFVLGTVAVGATFVNDVKFAIADGSADFIVGDGFNITVAAGSGKYALWDTTKTDGRETLVGVLGCDVAAAEEDVKAFMYVHGEFNLAALTAAHTIAAGVYNNGAIVIKELK